MNPISAREPDCSAVSCGCAPPPVARRIDGRHLARGRPLGRLRDTCSALHAASKPGLPFVVWIIPAHRTIPADLILTSHSSHALRLPSCRSLSLNLESLPSTPTCTYLRSPPNHSVFVLHATSTHQITRHFSPPMLAPSPHMSASLSS